MEKMYELPASLANTWNLTSGSQVPEADPTDAELAVVSTRPPTKATPVVSPRRKLGLKSLFIDEGFSCQSLYLTFS